MSIRSELGITPGRVDIAGTTFRDVDGRHLLLRGVNLGGDTKMPFSPNEHTYKPTDFANHRSVSFVGRPAPLEELDAHLARLAHWGFNCLRLLTTWEAVEHAAPGQHDQAYLDYFTEVCRRAGSYGLRVFIDFHQDVWSRMSGGSGAPGWTFEAAGLDFTKFGASGAAHVMQYEYDGRIGGRQPGYPVMSWSNNYSRPANGIMWTLFFAANDFAPSALIGGQSLQDYLQEHYLGSMRAIAERVAHLDNVIGFDTLNEPNGGYIGKGLSAPIVRYRGPIWTALDGLALASGHARMLPVVAPGQGIVGSTTVNADNVSIWLPGCDDPFRSAGAWDVVDGVPTAFQNEYFQRKGDQDCNLERDYMAPFFRRVADTIRAVRSDWLVFAEIDPFEVVTHGLPKGCPERTVNASHWYDVSALVLKSFTSDRRDDVLTGRVQQGAAAIEDAYVDEMTSIKLAGDRLNGGAPTLLGECGIQYDMNDAQAYALWAEGDRRSKIWSAQTEALDLMYNAIDRLLISSTQWNYTASNRNDPMIGDGWNQEDLSIWSVDQTTSSEDPNSGGRAIEGFCRPFVRAAQGTLLNQRFDRKTGLFEAEIRLNPSVLGPSEVYVPDVQYPAGYSHELNCTATVEQMGNLLLVRAAGDGVLKIRLVRR